MANVSKYAAVLAGLALTAAVVGAQATDEESIKAGKRIFNTEECTKCHGAEGKGKKDPDVQLDGVAERLDVAVIRRWITNPKEMTAQLEEKPKLAMKPVKLNDEEVDDLVAYLVSLEPR